MDFGQTKHRTRLHIRHASCQQHRDMRQHHDTDIQPTASCRGGGTPNAYSPRTLHLTFGSCQGCEYVAWILRGRIVDEMGFRIGVVQ